MTDVEVSIDPEQVPVHVAFNRVKSEIGAVGKNRRNEAQGYSFRSIEDFIDAASPVLARHGVIMLPRITEHRLYHFERVNSNNRASTSTVATVSVEWIVLGPMGDQLPTFCTVGEGADTADKATNKAMSAAFKYALSESMCIPLHLDDGDSSNGMNDDSSPGQARPRGQRAQRTQSTAKKAGAATAKKAGAATAAKPAAASGGVVPLDELPVEQQRLVARLRGLAPDHRRVVTEYCQAQRIILTHLVAPEVIAAVTAFVDGLPDELP